MQTIVTIATLILLLASLLVVNRARKEGNEERSSARAEAAEIRDEAKEILSEAQQREERVLLRERQIAEDQRNSQLYTRGLEERADVGRERRPQHEVRLLLGPEPHAPAHPERRRVATQ